jgi:hypothetical protein
MKLGFSYPLAHPYSVVVCQISGAKCFFGGWECLNKYWQGVSIQHCNIWQSDRWTLPFSDLDDHFLLSEWSLYLNHVYHGAYESLPFWGMLRKVCWKGSWYFWSSLCNFVDMHMKLCSNCCVYFWLWEAQVGLLSKFYIGMRVRSHQTRCDSYLGWILWRGFDESFWRLCFSPFVY